jgi:hypothetical protein
VNCRTLFHVEQKFGRQGTPRMADCGRFSFLLIPGDKWDVGIRFKKLDDNLRSSQHTSEIQDALRQERLYPGMEPTVHVMLGYRMKESLEPRVRSIFLTCEGPKENDWERVIWTEGEGMNPAVPFTRPLFQLPEPKFRERKPDSKPGDSTKPAEG